MIRYSDLKYLSVPLPEDVAKLKGFGDFARMERVIDLKLNKPGVPRMPEKASGAGKGNHSPDAGQLSL